MSIGSHRRTMPPRESYMTEWLGMPDMLNINARETVREIIWLTAKDSRETFSLLSPQFLLD